MRGTASIDDQPGVIMSVTKAPGFDTIGLTEQIEAALAELKPALPQGVEAMCFSNSATSSTVPSATFPKRSATARSW